MNKILGASAAALLAVTVLAGCGGDSDGGSSGGYCDDLKSTKASVTALGDADMTQATFEKLSASVHTIADEAPDDIKDDWNTVGDALDEFTVALSDAGLSIDDLDSLGQAGSPSVDPAKIQALTTAAGALDADAINTASDNINKEVKSECDIDLDFGN